MVPGFLCVVVSTMTEMSAGSMTGPVATLHVVVVAVPEVSLVHREQKKENVGRARVTALR